MIRLTAGALTTYVRALCGEGFGVSPSSLCFAADACSVSAFGFEHCWVAGVAVAPAQIRTDRASQGWVIGVIAVGDDELAQRPEMRLDRVRS